MRDCNSHAANVFSYYKIVPKLNHENAENYNGIKDEKSDKFFHRMHWNILHKWDFKFKWIFGILNNALPVRAGEINF